MSICEVEHVSGVKILNRNTVQIGSYILNFIIAWPGYDNVGSATWPEKIVIHAALDYLSQAGAQNQILLIRVEPINRRASRVRVLVVSRIVNPDEPCVAVVVRSEARRVGK